MNLFGKWIIKEVMTFGQNGAEFKSIDEIKGSPMEEMYEEMLNTMLVISPESVDTYVPIAEEDIEAAKAEGATVTEHGILVQSAVVKEENGEYFYDTRTTGEIDGEEISPFEKLEIGEDGLLTFGGGMMKFGKAE
ncbi:MAG: hypothetical protein E7473_11235 [Ruminococcaceae bacterium]|nr:hypothetical protein [Oscillospiraceae bacterium]